MQTPSDLRSSAIRWWSAAGVLAVLSFWRIIQLGSGTTFFFDEWNFLLTRNDISITNSLEGHNGHLSVIPVSVYQVLLRLFGAGTYFPYRALVAVLHCLISLVVGALIRRKSNNVVALAGVALVGFMGAGWQNWLWGFQIGMELSLLFGLLAVALLFRSPSTTNQNLVGLCVSVAVLSSGIGLSVVLGIGIAAVIRRQRVVLTWLAIILCLYGLWSVKYGQSQARSDNIGRMPTYVVESASAAFGGIGGWSLSVGGVLAGAALVLVIRNLWDRNRRSLEVMTLSIICMAGWILSGLSRAHLGEPGASRYVHAGISWIIPVVGILLAQRWRHEHLKGAAAIIVSTFAIWGSWDIATNAGREFRERSLIVRAEITAIGQIDSPVRPEYQPDPTRAPQITYGDFRAFGLKFRTPGLNPGTFRQLPEFVRREIDRVFITAPDVQLKPSSRPQDSQCRDVPANYEEGVKPGTIRWFQGVHSVELRRFATASTSLVPASPGAPSKLELGSDRNGRDWKLRYVSAAPFELCVVK